VLIESVNPDLAEHTGTQMAFAGESISIE